MHETQPRERFAISLGSARDLACWRWRLASANFSKPAQSKKSLCNLRSIVSHQVRCGESPQPAREVACVPRIKISHGLP